MDGVEKLIQQDWLKITQDTVLAFEALPGKSAEKGAGRSTSARNQR
jgi:hypothetical protein